MLYFRAADHATIVYSYKKTKRKHQGSIETTSNTWAVQERGKKHKTNTPWMQNICGILPRLPFLTKA